MRTGCAHQEAASPTLLAGQVMHGEAGRVSGPELVEAGGAGLLPASVFHTSTWLSVLGGHGQVPGQAATPWRDTHCVCFWASGGVFLLGVAGL